MEPKRDELTPETLGALAEFFINQYPYDNTARSLRSHADAWAADRARFEEQNIALKEEVLEAEEGSGLADLRARLEAAERQNALNDAFWQCRCHGFTPSDTPMVAEMHDLDCPFRAALAAQEK